ncbi:MAG: DHH family phosphoesterase [archaeon]
MISPTKLSKFRELLQNSTNPLFFFDNDVDGLTAALLLRRFVDKGKGVAIKTYPDLASPYIRKLDELKPDVIFILDKPLVSDQFIEAAKKENIKIVWMDHHPLPQNKDSVDLYLNPLDSKKPTNEPTSYWAYKITNKKEDEWIAMLGCLSDWFLPEYSKEFAKQYPGLFFDVNNPAIAMYETQLGKLMKILDFALKDRTSAIVNMLRLLFKVKTPYELLEENAKTKQIFNRYRQINRRYEKLVEKGKIFAYKARDSKVVFFQYGGELSLSSPLANELFYNNPDKIIVVAYISGTKVNVSVRGKVDVREMVAKAMQGMEGTSGGHQNSCGAMLGVEDLPQFRENMIKFSK